MAAASSRQRWGALALYLLISIGFFAIPILAHLRQAYVGDPADPADPHAFIWFMHWWPHALGHGLNPLITREVWAPTGLNLATATSVPLAGVAGWPITSGFGPVAAYNVMMLLAPALAAWTGFLLIRSVTGAFLPSLLGGYLFGFSSYELAHLTAHLNLSMVFLMPVCVLLVLRHLRREIGRRAFVVLFALALSGQFLLSLEVFATMTFFGGIALAVWLWITRRTWSGHWGAAWRPAGPIVLGYLVAAAIVSPFLIQYARHGPFGLLALRDPVAGAYQGDLLNFVIPTRVTAAGGGGLASVSARFAGGLAENGSYVGIALIAIGVLFARRVLRTQAGRLLTTLSIVVAVASLGSTLVVGGARTIPMPWALFQHVPLISAALPVRFSVYLFLLLAVMAAMWLAAAKGPSATRGRWALAGLTVVLLFPNLPSSPWHGALSTPPFISQDLYRRYIARGENVLVIPSGRAGAQSLRWQIETDSYFRLAVGYLSIQFPPEFECWPIMPALFYGVPDEQTAPLLDQFMAAKGVSVVILVGPRGAPWRATLEELGLHPVEAGGVTVARVVRLGAPAPPAAAPCPPSG
jgi:hypothetical protein